MTKTGERWTWRRTEPHVSRGAVRSASRRAAMPAATAPDDASTAWRERREWILRRPRVVAPHLAPIAAVGRDADGRPELRHDVVSGTPFPDALDQLGSLTPGVAVTLTLPLVDLLQTFDRRRDTIGAVGVEDVLIDDSGAPVVVDRAPDGRPGERGILVAIRCAWERVDPRTHERAEIDPLIADAMTATGYGESHRLASPQSDALAALRAGIVAAGPARPVRWRHADAIPAVPRSRARAPWWAGRFGDVLAHGIPLPTGARLPWRRALVGAIVAAGCLAAAWSMLPGGSTTTAGSRAPLPASVRPSGATDTPSPTDLPSPTDAPPPAGFDPSTADPALPPTAEAPDSPPTDAAVALMNRRLECQTSACLATTTVHGSPQRSRDAGPARRSMTSWQQWTAARLIDELADSADRALVLVEDASGMQTASVLLERTEAGWRIRSEVMGAQNALVTSEPGGVQ